MEAVKPSAVAETSGPGFLARHQFLIYRLFSLAGLLPIGAYVVMHLAVNASVLAGPAMYQKQVDQIHALGDTMVGILEWGFIFIPIGFHALVGFWIISGGLPNVGSYPYGSNVRYTLQRATGMLVAAFIVFHLWQMHHLGKHLGGGNFDAEHAASSAAIVLSPVLMTIIYTVGTLCAVYHLANGIWTFGITWGIWTSEAAQRRAGYVCAAVGIVVATLGMGSLYGMSRVNVPQARAIEDRIQHAQEMLDGQMAAGTEANRDALVGVTMDRTDPQPPKNN
ncbi:MAG TPA: succinate dehydrogenase [Pirellulales bacterium]|nr:succinate dehydrogenase [Pirellulales bacterium]